MVAGDMVNLAFYEGQTSSTSRVKLTNAHDFSTATTSGIVSFIDKSSAATPYVQLKALAVGTTNVSVVLDGDDGFFARSFKVQVLSKSSFPSGAYISTSSTYKSNSSSSPLYLVAGKTGSQLSLYNSSGNQLTGSNYWGVSWTSSDTSIATVDPAVGSITKVVSKKPGNVTITATDSNGNKLYFYYFIYNPVTGISKTAPMKVGVYNEDPWTFLITSSSLAIYPSDATFTALTDFNWKSTDNTVATIGSVSASSVTVNVAKDISTSCTIQAQPIPDFNLGYTDVTTIQSVNWLFNCIGGSSLANGSTSTASGGISIKKGSTVYLQIYDTSNKVSCNKTYTSVSSSNTSAVSVDRFSFGGTTGSCVRLIGNATGTSSVKIQYNTDGYFFSRTITVTVVN